MNAKPNTTSVAIKGHPKDAKKMFRRPPEHVFRRKSRTFRHQLRIYCCLHTPNGYSNLYHSIVISLVIVNCIIINIFHEIICKFVHSEDESLTVLMAVLDTILLIVLSVELTLRFWSSESIRTFEGFKGKIAYLRANFFARVLDIIAIITFLTTITLIILDSFDGTAEIVLRLLHVIQVFQTSRLLFRILKVMSNTIYDQLNQLSIAFVFGGLSLLFAAFGLFIFEKSVNEQINNMFDAIWWAVITLSTIG